MATTTRTVISIAGGAQYIRGRQSWGRADHVQTCCGGSDTKRFASTSSARRWVARYSASILPEVWGGVTLGEAAEQGMLEIVSR
jgi:hypothetical protein